MSKKPDISTGHKVREMTTLSTSYINHCTVSLPYLQVISITVQCLYLNYKWYQSLYSVFTLTISDINHCTVSLPYLQVISITVQCLYLNYKWYQSQCCVFTITISDINHSKTLYLDEEVEQSSAYKLVTNLVKLELKAWNPNLCLQVCLPQHLCLLSLVDVTPSNKPKVKLGFSSRGKKTLLFNIQYWSICKVIFAQFVWKFGAYIRLNCVGNMPGILHSSFMPVPYLSSCV